MKFDGKLVDFDGVWGSTDEELGDVDDFWRFLEAFVFLPYKVTVLNDSKNIEIDELWSAKEIVKQTSGCNQEQWSYTV